MKLILNRYFLITIAVLLLSTSGRGAIQDSHSVLFTDTIVEKNSNQIFGYTLKLCRVASGYSEKPFTESSNCKFPLLNSQNEPILLKSLPTKSIWITSKGYLKAAAAIIAAAFSIIFISNNVKAYNLLKHKLSDALDKISWLERHANKKLIETVFAGTILLSTSAVYATINSYIWGACDRALTQHWEDIFKNFDSPNFGSAAKVKDVNGILLSLSKALNVRPDLAVLEWIEDQSIVVNSGNIVSISNYNNEEI